MEPSTSIESVLSSLQDIFGKNRDEQGGILGKIDSFFTNLDSELKDRFVAILSTLAFRLKGVDHTLNERTSLFEKNMLDATTELDIARSSLSQLDTQLNIVEKERDLALQEKKKLELHYEAKIRDMSIASLEIQNNDKIAELERQLEGKQFMLENMQSEVHYLNNKNKEHLGELEMLHGQLSDVRSRHRIAESEISTMSGQIQHWKHMHEGVLERYNQIQMEYATYRQNLSSNTSQEKLQIANLEAENRKLTETLSEMKVVVEERSRRVDFLSENISQLSNQMETEQRSFKKEMSSQIKLSGLYKSSLEEIREKLIQIEGSHEVALAAAKRKNDEMQEELNESRETINTLKLELDKKDETIATMENSSLVSGDTDYSKGFSPSANILNRLRKSGRTLSDVYTENRELSVQLQTSTSENNRLNELLRQICSDIELKSDALHAERTELIETREAAKKLTQDIDNLASTNQSIGDELKQLRITSADQRKHAQLLEQSNKDLSKQIIVLLAQLEGVVPDIDSLDTTGKNPDSASSVISEQLVTFTSLQELQSRNSQLLTLVRDLSDQLEQMEHDQSALVSVELNQKLETLQTELNSIQMERQQEIVLVEKLVRQRDLLKELLYQGEIDLADINKSSLAEIRELELEELITHNSNSHHRDVQSKQQNLPLLERIEQLQAEKTAIELEHKGCAELSTTLAGMKIQVDFLKERLSNVTALLNMKETDLTHLQAKQDQLKNVLVDYQGQVAVLTEKRAVSAHLESSLNANIAQIEREKKEIMDQLQQLQTVHNRLLIENESLKSQSAFASDRLTYLDRDYTSRLNNLQSRLDSQQEEQQTLRASNNSLMQDAKIASFKAEKASSLVEAIRMESANQVSNLENSLLQKQKDLEILESQLSQANTRWKESEKRVDVLLMLSSTNRGPSSRRESFSPSSEINAKNDNFDEDATNLSSSDQLSGSTLTLLDRYIALQRQVEAALAEKKHALEEKSSLKSIQSNLQSSLSAMESQLTRLQDSLANAEQTISLRDRALEAEREERASLSADYEEQLGSLQAKIQSYQSLERQYLSQSSALNQDMKRLERELSDKEALYKSLIVTHAKDIEALLEARKSLSHVEQEKFGLVESLASLESSSSKALADNENLRKSLEEKVKTLENRIGEVSLMNDRLLDQLQNEQSHINTSNVSLLSDIDSTSAPDSANQVYVLKALRREKDLVSLELSCKEQEVVRLENELIKVQSSLDSHIDQNSLLKSRLESVTEQLRHRLDPSVLVELEKEKELLKASINGLLQDKSAKEAELESQLKSAKQNLNAAEERLIIANKSIEKLQERLDHVLSQLNELEKVYQGSQESLQELQKTVRTQSVDQALEKQKELVSVQLEHSQLQEEVNQLKDTLSSVNASVAEKDSLIGRYKNALKVAHAQKIALSQENQDREDLLAELEEKILDRDNKITSYQEKIASMQEQLQTQSLSKDLTIDESHMTNMENGLVPLKKRKAEQLDQIDALYHVIPTDSAQEKHHLEPSPIVSYELDNVLHKQDSYDVGMSSPSISVPHLEETNPHVPEAAVSISSVSTSHDVTMGESSEVDNIDEPISQDDDNEASTFSQYIHDTVYTKPSEHSEIPEPIKSVTHPENKLSDTSSATPSVKTEESGSRTTNSNPILYTSPSSKDLTESSQHMYPFASTVSDEPASKVLVVSSDEESVDMEEEREKLRLREQELRMKIVASQLAIQRQQKIMMSMKNSAGSSSTRSSISPTETSSNAINSPPAAIHHAVPSVSSVSNLPENQLLSYTQATSAHEPASQSADSTPTISSSTPGKKKFPRITPPEPSPAKPPSNLPTTDTHNTTSNASPVKLSTTSPMKSAVADVPVVEAPVDQPSTSVSSEVPLSDIPQTSSGPVSKKILKKSTLASTTLAAGHKKSFVGKRQALKRKP